MRHGMHLAVAGSIAVLLVSGTAGADSPPPLTLSQAVQLAGTGNGELRVLKEEQGIIAGERLSAIVRPNPSLEVDGASGAPFGNGEDYGIGIGLSQEFVTAGKLAKRQRVGDLALAAYRWRLADRERLLAEEVTVAYREVQVSRKRQEVAETGRDLSRKLLAVASDRFAAGDIPELELNLARVEVARSKGRILDRDRELIHAEARLAGLLGLTPDEVVTVEPLTTTVPAIPVPATLQEGLELRRPDLRALAAERQRGDEEQAAARAERIPNVTGSLFYRHDEMTFEIDGQQGLKRDDTLGLRLAIPLPLFDRNQGKIREAAARTARSEREYEAALATARREVATAHARVASADRVVALYAGDILPQLEENLRLMREAYQLGEVGIISVIDEQRKYLEVQENYLNDLAARHIARARLAAAAAEDLKEGLR